MSQEVFGSRVYIVSLSLLRDKAVNLCCDWFQHT